jgi:putative membrane protein
MTGSTTSSDTQASTSTQTFTQGKLGASDRQLVRQLAYANLAEIEAGRMAQSKSTNDQVRSFAQQMIDDHTRALQQLQQLADAKGITLPTKPNEKHRAQAARLNKLSGDAFDRQYLANAGLSDHRKTHALVSRVQSTAKNSELKQLAANLLPNIDQHLRLAQQVHASHESSTGSSTGSSSSTSGSSSSTPSGSSGMSGNQSGTSGSGATDSTGSSPSSSSGTSPATGAGTSSSSSNSSNPATGTSSSSSSR